MADFGNSHTYIIPERIMYTYAMTSDETGFVPVAIALGGNILVTIAKFLAAAFSGSSVLFSEAVHSSADTANQILLLIGLQRSQKKPDDEHDYGYGNERFFWALISACGIFFLGAGLTALHGIEALLHPTPIAFNWIIAASLVFSAAVESYSFSTAFFAIQKTFPDLGWQDQLRGADSSTLAVYLEDAVAILGIIVAASAISLSYYTNSPLWDALGSLVVAALLALVAVILIIKNRSYLLGKSMSQEMEAAIIEILNADPSVERVMDFKSSTVGWDVYRVKCEIEFNGDSLVREAYGGTGIREQYDQVREDFEAFKRFAAEYADRIPRLMGRKVDEMEKHIKAAYPSVRHIDIEIN